MRRAHWEYLPLIDTRCAMVPLWRSLYLVRMLVQGLARNLYRCRGLQPSRCWRPGTWDLASRKGSFHRAGRPSHHRGLPRSLDGARHGASLLSASLHRASRGCSHLLEGTRVYWRRATHPLHWNYIANHGPGRERLGRWQLDSWLLSLHHPLRRHLRLRVCQNLTLRSSSDRKCLRRSRNRTIWSIDY